MPVNEFHQKKDMLTKFKDILGHRGTVQRSRPSSMEDLRLVTNEIKHLDMNNSTPYGEDEEIPIGVYLTSESCGALDARDLCLGFVLCKPHKKSLQELHDELHIHLPALPKKYQFITKHRWPVKQTQESGVMVKHVLLQDNSIRILKCYDNPRVGVKTADGNALGFIYADLKATLDTLRKKIRDTLGHIQNVASFEFLDRNSWPIRWEQEDNFTLMDIIIGSYICISTNVYRQDESHAGKIVPKKSSFKASVKRKRPLQKQLTFGSSKDEVRFADNPDCAPVDSKKAKQILISYVRAEAAQAALELKRELEKLRYSVYLDVHEIKIGNDWQDSLNFAVSNCEVFVPLITQRYGATQWTNREVKLADVLGKYILPVSFLDTWPPPCLAIQFATTQFIQWGPAPDPNSKGSTETGGTWSLPEYATPANIENLAPHGRLDSTGSANGTTLNGCEHSGTVAKELSALLKFNRMDKKTRKLSSRRAPLTRQATLQMNYPSPLPITLPEGSSDHLDHALKCRPLTMNGGKPLIVVSVNPEERTYSNHLKVIFEEEGYEVWSSLVAADLTDEELLEEQSKAGLELAQAIFCSNKRMSINERKSMVSCNSLDISAQLKNRVFQQKADEAAVVIFVLSKAFAKSRTSQQQVFYCEHRKRCIPLKYEDFSMPGWMSMLIGTDTYEVTQENVRAACKFSDAQAKDYQEALSARIRRAVNPDVCESTQEELNEAKLSYAVKSLKNILNNEFCVYISGGTKFYFSESSDICQAIGKHLAHLEPPVTLVTGGFFGVGQEVGSSFFEEQQRLKKGPTIWHALPCKDDKDCRKQGRQNDDKTFQHVPYGRTVFTGDSVRERETIVSRVCDICILVEGGPGAAHEAEQFTWNDHIVIPVRKTEGAAGGKFNVPDKIFHTPNGVNHEDWNILGSDDASSDQVGAAVAKITQCLLEKMRNEAKPPSDGEEEEEEESEEEDELEDDVIEEEDEDDEVVPPLMTPDASITRRQKLKNSHSAKTFILQPEDIDCTGGVYV